MNKLSNASKNGKGSIEKFKLLIQSIKNEVIRGIQVVLVYVPTISYYNQAEPGKFEQELNFFKKLNRDSPDVFYLEYLKGWDTRHAFFFDPIHLNPEGQQALTDSVLKDLNPLIHGISGI